MNKNLLIIVGVVATIAGVGWYMWSTGMFSSVEPSEGGQENRTEEPIEEADEVVEIGDELSNTVIQNPVHQFPEDYVPRIDELPLGFQLTPVEPTDTELPTGNPGYLSSSYLNTSFSPYIAVYSKQETPNIELGVYVFRVDPVQGKSETQLLEEVGVAAPGSFILKKDNILVSIWTDSNLYWDDVAFVAEKLKKRLELEDFIFEDIGPSVLSP